MTAFDRIERRMPELMDELAAPGLPEYFDDMLRQTAQARQRPAWSALERWLPMGVIAQPLPVRPMPWRLLALVALIGLLAATALVYMGSQRRVPPPFGPARNGVLAIGTTDGDIVLVDPVTDNTTPLISGSTFDGGPAYLPDGQRFLFDRGTSATDPAPALFIANADGTGVRQLLKDETGIIWLDPSPSGDRVLVTRKIAQTGTVSIVDIKSGTSTTLDLGLNVTSASWRPNHDQFVLSADTTVGHTFWVVNADGSGRRQIPASPYAINEPTLSPDGSRLAYATWEPVPGPIRIVDIDNGGDRPLATPNEYQTYLWQGAQFSPDGTKVLVHQFVQNSNPVVAQLAVIDVADGAVTTIGPMSQNPQPDAMFSPDGTKILATYSTTTTTWMFDADGLNGREVPFVAIRGQSWQRLAP
jgi:Tol biopolymer transport system component